MRKLGTVLAVVFGVAAATVFGLSCFFLPPYATVESEFGTIEVEGVMTERAVADALKAQMLDTEITAKTIDFDEFQFKIGDVVAEVNDAALLAKVSSKPCFIRVVSPNQKLTIFDTVTLDADALQETFINNKLTYRLPQDAHVAYSPEEKGFQVVDAEIGNMLLDNAGELAAKEIKANLKSNLELAKIGCYQMPLVYATDPALNEQAAKLNRFKNVSITYKIDEETKEIVDIETFHDWLIYDATKDEPVSISEEKLDEFVEAMDKKYTTAHKARTFKTSTDSTVEFESSAGDYGWILDKEALRKSLLEHLTGRNVTIEDMPFIQRADVFKGNALDISDTYVEISIENQHLWYYKDGELAIESDVVTGDLAKKHNTNRGVFALKGKYRNRTLRGPGYASFVKYWMPFDGGIGMHDASWRTAFGGNIYKTNGSHGCVNLPSSVARFIYENISLTTPVIVY